MDVVNLRDSIKYIIGLSSLLWYSLAAEAVEVCAPVLPCKIEFNAPIDTQSFTTSGDANWLEAANDGGDYFAAISPNLVDDQSASLAINAENNVSHISFDFSVSSEQNYDFLEFYVDGQLRDRWSGEIERQTVHYALTNSPYTFEWRYIKDGSISSGEDRATLYEISFNSTVYDFESSELDNEFFSIQGNGSWTVSSDDVSAGLFSLALSESAEGQTTEVSSLTFDFYSQDYTSLAFDLKTLNALQQKGAFNLYIDGQYKDAWYGYEGSWQTYEYQLSPGFHQFEFRYSGSDNLETPEQLLFIDNIILRPVFVLQGGFEDAAAQPKFFEFSGSELWTVEQTSEAYEGNYALISPSSGESSSVILQTGSDIHSITFHSTLDYSEANENASTAALELFIDGELYSTYTNSDWLRRHIELEPGNNTIEWRFSSTEGVVAQLDNITLNSLKIDFNSGSVPDEIQQSGSEYWSFDDSAPSFDRFDDFNFNDSFSAPIGSYASGRFSIQGQFSYVEFKYYMYDFYDRSFSFSVDDFMQDEYYSSNSWNTETYSFAGTVQKVEWNYSVSADFDAESRLWIDDIFLSNPFIEADTDQDGLVDAIDEDDDNDGVSDTQEIIDGSSPYDYSSVLDTDGDTVPDAYESEQSEYATDPLVADAVDSDQDGVSDYVEAFPGENDRPIISGTPDTFIVQGEFYSFTPTFSDADGDDLTLSVSGLPSWLSFDESTSTISGTPGYSDVTGSQNNYIYISVTDGTSSSSLPSLLIEVEVSPVSPIWKAKNSPIQYLSSQIKLQPDDPISGHIFGESVGIFDQDVLVGAVGDDDNGSSSGAVYVFRDNNAGYQQQQKITAFDGESGDLFGSTIATNEQFLLIGARSDTDGDPLQTGVEDNGSVYVYEKDNNQTYQSKQKLVAANADSYARFGTSIDLNDNLLAIGAPSSGFEESSGSVFVFTLDQESNFVESQELSDLLGAPDALFGASVAVNDDLIVVGSPGKNLSAGEVLIFAKNDQQEFAVLQTLTSPQQNPDSFFGNAVAIFQDKIVVGADGNADGEGLGALFIYQRNLSGDFQLTQTLEKESRFVTSSFGKTLIAVNDGFIASDYLNYAGLAAIFNIGNDNLYSRSQSLFPFSASRFDYFADSIAATDALFVAGSWGDDDNGSSSGSAYVFAADPDFSIQTAEQTLTENTLFDFAYQIEQQNQNSLVYSITGDDKDFFSVSEQGSLTFVDPPNYEQPEDSDGDNTYVVNVVANDGEFDVVLTLTVVIEDDPDTDNDGTEDIIDNDDDNDGVPDSIETEQGSDPLDYHSYVDTDEDGVPNYLDFEGSIFASDPLVSDAIDTDNDGVSDYIEAYPGEDDLPVISGVPSNQAIVDQSYSFTPVASDADGDPLTFEVENLPSWLDFDSTTGTLSTEAVLPTTFAVEDIIISVRDDKDNLVSLPPFSILAYSDDTTLLQDEYEENDTFETASFIFPQSRNLNEQGYRENVTVQHHTFNSANDIDWMQFDISPVVDTNDGRILDILWKEIASNIAMNCEEDFDITGLYNCNPSWEGISTNADITLYQLNEDTNELVEVRQFKMADINVVISNDCEQSSVGPFCENSTSEPTAENVFYHYQIENLDPGRYYLKIDPTAHYATNSSNNYKIEIFDFPSLPGIIQGVISNQNGLPLSGVSIKFADLNKTMRSLPTGVFFRSVGIGDYEITFSKDGYETETNNISINSEQEGLLLPKLEVTMRLPNSAPEISGNPPSQVAQGEEYSFTPTVYDAQNDILTFAIDNKPSWAEFNESTGALQGTPTDSDVGTTDDIVISVADTSNEAASLASFSITVLNINDAPTIAGTPATNVQQGSFYSFTPTSSDLDGDVLTFAIINKPVWADFDTSSGQLSGTPSSVYVGNYQNIQISVTDTSNSKSVLPAFSINVANVNDAPQISGTPNTTGAQGAAYSFVPTASDPDGDTLSFAITNKPSWATFNDASGALTGTPTNADVGLFSAIQISVTDTSNVSASLPSFNIQVRNVNDAPTISGIPQTSVLEDSEYRFTPMANDIDANDTLTFVIQNQPSWLVFSSLTGELSGIPSNNDVGTYSNIRISVVDQSDSVASLSQFSISVSNVNDAPTITGTPSLEVNQDALYTFTPTAQDADTADSITFGIENKPSWAEFNSSNGTLSGTPVNSDVAIYSGIVITVTDSFEASSSLAAFNLEVKNINDAPTISGTPTSRVSVGNAYSFVPTANDIDLNETLTFSIENKPSWVEFDVLTGAMTGQPENSDIGLFENIIVKVTDSGNLAVELIPEFSIQVTSNNTAPTLSGTPLIEVSNDVQYSFVPVSNDAEGDKLVFTIENKPSWASFNEDTGELSGAPKYSDIATYTDISIAVSDGEFDDISLSPFSIVVVLNDPEGDADLDGLTNQQEYDLGTNPYARDSDEDGIPDGFEISNNLNPLDPLDALLDSDDDGLENLKEFQFGTRLDTADTDNDGISDLFDNEPLIFNPADESLVVGEMFVVPDMNEDGNPDLAVFSEQSEIDSYQLMIFDGLDDTPIRTISWDMSDYVEASLHIIGDLNNDQVPEFGVFGIRTEPPNAGKPQLFVRDGKTGNRVNVYNWPANWRQMSLVVLPDLTLDGLPEIAIQGRFKIGARPQLIVKDGLQANTIAIFAFPNLWDDPQYFSFSDANNDGIDDIALFGRISKNNKPQVKRIDGSDPSNKMAAYTFPDNWQDVSFHRLPDVNFDDQDDWGLFGTRRDDGRPQLLIKNATNHTGVIRLYAWSGNMQNAQFYQLSDMNADGIGEFGAGGYRDDSNRYQLLVKDGADRNVTLANYSWPNNWSEVSLHVLGDITGDGIDEVGLFGKTSEGIYQLVVRNGIANQGELLRWDVGSNWFEKPKLILPGDLNGDGLMDLIVYGQNQAKQSSMNRRISENN